MKAPEAQSRIQMPDLLYRKSGCFWKVSEAGNDLKKLGYLGHDGTYGIFYASDLQLPP